MDANYEVTFDVPNVRNGAVEDIVAMVPRATVPIAYQWIGIAGIDEEDHVTFALVYARLTAAWIRVQEPGMPIAEVRAKAIVLAGIRVGALVAYRLTGHDISDGEFAGSLATYVDGGDDNDDSAAIMPDDQTVEGFAAAFGAIPTLTEAEQVLLNFHITLGVPVVVTQGWSIVKCGHHFLSAPGLKMKSSWDAVKRQFGQMSTPEVREFVTQNSEWWEDIAFHKACHPVSMVLKQSLASDPEVAQRVSRSGWGSAAVRLPVVESEFEVVKAVMALANKVREPVMELGGTFTVDHLAQLIANVFSAHSTQARAVATAEAVQFVNDRAATVAYMGGMLQEMTMTSGTSTILTAFSIKRILQAEPSSTNRGQTDYRSILRKRQEDIAAGVAHAANITL